MIGENENTWCLTLSRFGKATALPTGTTVMVGTHDMHTVDRMQMRVIALDQGRIVRDGEGGYNEDPGDTGEIR